MMESLKGMPEWPAFLNKAWEKSRFETFTHVQRQAIPHIYQGGDVVAEAPTGSGKTLAYLLPLLQKIDQDKKQTQVMVLASSHELVMQIHHEIQEWTDGSGISSTPLIGGANIKRQMEKLKKKPAIVVGTPGRIYELMDRKKIKVHEIRTLVMDEADQLLIPEHTQTVQGILKALRDECQILLLSATLPEEVIDVAETFMNPEAEVIQIEVEDQKPDVQHVYIRCEDREKVDMLRKLSYVQGFVGLAFMQDIAKLNVFAEKLTYKKLDVGLIHSDAKKEHREKAIREFRKGEYSLLLATDVAARGLDIKDITFIVNLDIPKDVTSYFHRSGRTARLGAKDGMVVSLVNPIEEKRLKKYATELDLPLLEKELYRGQLVDR